MKKIYTFDSTLRDGAQSGSISFSVSDKLNIVKILDDFGVDFIEAGNPFSNPKDIEFFNKLSKIKLNHSKIVAFGSTRRKNTSCCDDLGLNALLSVPFEYVTIFGKSSIYHTEQILGTTKEENLAMISQSIEYAISKGKNVVYDAEHFFDGYKENADYAIKTLQTAENAGAKWIVLCDTNGGCFPDEISNIVSIVKSQLKTEIGIHCHDDTGCAVANTIAAVKCGVTQIQGTFTGFGERCGNANLSSIIPSLQIKLGYQCTDETNLKTLTNKARYVAEISNISLSDSMPYVGKSAFAHKGGMHVDGVTKSSNSFEHIEPFSVGNNRKFLLSEVAGRTAVISKLKELIPEISKQSEYLNDIIEMLKTQEHNGYYYEAAQASFELLVLKFLGRFSEFFRIDYFKIIGEQSGGFQKAASAIVKVFVGTQSQIAAAEGDGPVNALDKALRSALSGFYPEIINTIELIDYKVRVIDTGAGTAAVVRVLIESKDGDNTWTCVGASTDIINASVKALVDSIEYKLYKSGINKIEN